MKLIIIIICLVLFGVHHFKEQQKREELATEDVEVSTPSHRTNSLYESPNSSVATTQSTSSPSAFTCDGRVHCSQMHSCEEATFFINNCPGTKMDGDNDGIPCEQQFC